MFVSSVAALAFASTAARAPITESHLLDHLRALCHPRMEGRLTLQPGERLAAEYLVGEMNRIGLSPGWHDGFIHKFPLNVNFEAAGDNRKTLVHNDGRRWNLKLGTDYVPLVGSVESEVDAPLAWVGYGIKREGRDDFGSLDMKGKVAVMLRAQAPGADPSPLRERILAAKEKGAAGVILVGPAAPGHTDLPRPTRRHGLPADAGMAGTGLHASYLDELTGIAYEDAVKAASHTPRDLPVKVSKKTTMRQKSGQGLNVVGFLPGTDPVLKYEYIVVGAHYDHLGYGEVGSRTGNEIIHPGADDNASGVAGVLELAEYFKINGGNKRTIIFQLYSGEEVGLIGANAWANDYSKKLVNVSAMINMDMIGRVRENKVTIFATSTSREWDPIIDSIDTKGLVYAKVPTVASNSDHAPFARRQVPVVFWHSNLTEEYHTEKDTIETLNMPGMVKILDGVKQMIKGIDSRPNKLAWNTDAQMAARGGQGRTVRIGFMPDMGATGPGVLLSGVTANSPAAKAGLQKGDRIIEMGSRKINSMEDMQAAFQGLRAGEKVKVTFIRDGKTQTVELTPERG